MKKMTGKDWYRYHGRKAAEKSVNESKSVSLARDEVRRIQNELCHVRDMEDDSLGANIRRALFGKNAGEKELDLRIEVIEKELRSADATLSAAIKAARHAGWSSYGAAWASRQA